MMPETDRARAALQTIPPDLPRDEWHAIGRAAIAAGLTVDDVDTWSAPAENYSGRRDIESAFRTIKPDGGTGAGTLFHHAKQYGFGGTENTRPSLSINQPAKAQHKPVKQAASIDPAEIWGRCLPADDADAYINRKHGKPDGLRIYPATAALLIIRGQNVGGYLAVPCWDGDTLQTIQFIPPAGGDKLNLPGASFGTGFLTVGEITDRAYIVEGIGQAWAVNHATGAAAVVCFGAGRMAAVAKTLRSKHSSAHLIVVPDRGKEEQAAKIAADVAGQWVAMPDDKPGNYDANDYAAEHGSEALAALLERPQTPPLRFKLLSGAELSNAPPMRWMVRGVLPVEGLAALFGASGSGKSFLMLEIAAAVAGGEHEWFGRRITQAPVTYVCLEGEAGIGKRVKAWSLHNNAPVPDALRFITQPFDLLSDDVPELAKAITTGGGSGGLVILDTLNRAAPGADENSSVDMGNLIAASKRLQSLTGGLVLLVHHTGKDTTKGLRGHSSLYAALDGAIEVTATDNHKAWSVAKSKDDVTGDAHPFKLQIVQVGTDDEGEEVTSCVAVPDESGDAIKAKRSTLGANQKIARDVLGEPLRKSPHMGKEGAPTGRPCIDYSEAVELVAERMPTDAKHRKSRAISAIGGLVAKGYMGMKGDWLWDN